MAPGEHVLFLQTQHLHLGLRQVLQQPTSLRGKKNVTRFQREHSKTMYLSELVS